MKYSLTILLLMSLSAFSQECIVLDNFRSYHGIKFGEAFPDSLKKYFGIDSTEKDKEGIIKYVTYSFLSDVEPYKQFANWFTVGSDFEQIAFSCDNEGKVIEITLTKMFPIKTANAFSPSNYPIFFKNVLSELKLLFGTPSLSDKKYIRGATTIYAYSWQCDIMNVITTCSYDKKGLSYRLTLFDMNLKKKQKVERYK